MHMLKKLLDTNKSHSYGMVLMQTMAWILDEYSKFHGHSPAVVTGKPIVSRLKRLYLSL